MAVDFSKEVKELIKKYVKENIVFGKTLNMLLFRLAISKEEIEKEIISCENLSFTEKQIKDREERYALFFSYNKKRGRKYVITFRGNNIRIITIFPLGRKTLKKYRKKGLNM